MICEQCKVLCPMLPGQRELCPLNRLDKEVKVYEQKINDELGKMILKELDRQREIKQLSLIYGE